MVKQLCVAYASWCPCPEWLEHGDFATDTNVYRCSAGGAQLKKAASEAAAWEIIKNHCVNSPFHKLNEEQWQYLVDGNLIKIKGESWQEPLPDDGEDGLIEAKEEPMSGEDRGRPSKRRRSEPEQGGVPTRTKVSKGDGGIMLSQPALAVARRSSAASSGSGSDNIVMRRSQYRLLLDAMKRAGHNARGVERLCNSASESFRAAAAGFNTEAAAMEAGYDMLISQFGTADDAI